VIIIEGAVIGIVAGCGLIFVLQFLASMMLGRTFCGWICPAGGAQECFFMASDKQAKGGKWNWIKYGIWVLWIFSIVVAFFIGGEPQKMDFWFHTFFGSPASKYGHMLVIYYVVLGIIFLSSLVFGKRAFCHYICWMAPFMVLGTKLQKVLSLPALHLTADGTKCTSCRICNKHCPMSLDVQALVTAKFTSHNECILCGACSDHCPKNAIHYEFH